MYRYDAETDRGTNDQFEERIRRDMARRLIEGIPLETLMRFLNEEVEVASRFGETIIRRSVSIKLYQYGEKIGRGKKRV